MAVNEACQVWIEQRITEELEEKGTSGKSLRAIGKEISKEIERIFEAKVKPGTILTKVARAAKSVSNETQKENQKKSEDSGELEKLENEVMHGGARKNAGRKPREYPKAETESFGVMEGTESFCEAFEQFYTQVQNAQLEKWQNIPKRSAIYCIKLLTDLIGE